jgi:hypothetical protein
MVGDSDDDPSKEWDADPTIIDELPEQPASRDTTAPHDLRHLAVSTEVAIARDEACQHCYTEGQDDAISALKLVLREHDVPDDQGAHIVLAVRNKLTRL